MQAGKPTAHVHAATWLIVFALVAAAAGWLLARRSEPTIVPREVVADARHGTGADIAETEAGVDTAAVDPHDLRCML